jgi:membrane protein
VRYTLTGVFLAGGLLLAHVWLPPGRVGLLTAVPGVVLTLILWLVGASAFGYWFSRFSNYASTYAGLGSIMAVIFFLYINSALFILGGEVNAVLCARREARETRQRHANDEEDTA